MLCQESISRQIGTLFVPLYLELNDGLRHDELNIPDIPYEAGHAHFAFVLTPDGRVINLRPPGGDQLDNSASFRKTLDGVISSLNLKGGESLPVQPFPPRNACLNLRVVSRYEMQVVPCRRQIDLQAEDVEALLPEDGTLGPYTLPKELVLKIAVALRPVYTPHPQQLLQSEADAVAYDRVKTIALDPIALSPSEGKTTVLLRGSMLLGPRPDVGLPPENLSGSAGVKYGDPRGHINASGASISGYLRYDSTSRKVEAFDLVTDGGWYEYGPHSKRMKYISSARLSSEPPSR